MPKVVAKIFRVWPFGSVPASMRWIVLTEMPDFSNNSFWVRFKLSRNSCNLDIDLRSFLVCLPMVLVKNSKIILLSLDLVCSNMCDITIHLKLNSQVGLGHQNFF